MEHEGKSSHHLGQILGGWVQGQGVGGTKDQEQFTEKVKASREFSDRLRA